MTTATACCWTTGTPDLPADDFVFRLLQMVLLGGFAAGQGSGSGDFSQRQREAVRHVRRYFRPTFQPGEILYSLCEAGTQTAEERQRPKTTYGSGQIGCRKSA